MAKQEQQQQKNLKLRKQWDEGEEKLFSLEKEVNDLKKQIWKRERKMQSIGNKQVILWTKIIHTSV